jgi:small neutral amino acid transporter SnatA (MarC family)
MVFELRRRRESKAAEDAVEEHVHHIAAFPLAIPLLAGPGAITAVILLPLIGQVAVWFGSRAKRRIDASQGALGGRAVASWGVWLGWIGVLLTLVMAALVAIYFAGD